jgi:hypothetical protein
MLTLLVSNGFWHKNQRKYRLYLSGEELMLTRVWAFDEKLSAQDIYASISAFSKNFLLSSKKSRAK